MKRIIQKYQLLLNIISPDGICKNYKGFGHVETADRCLVIQKIMEAIIYV